MNEKWSVSSSAISRRSYFWRQPMGQEQFSMTYNFAVFRRNGRAAGAADFQGRTGHAIESRPEPLCAALDRNGGPAKETARDRRRIPITQELSAIMCISGKLR